MDEFKHKLKIRIFVMRLYSAAVALLLALSAGWNVFGSETNALSFTLGASTGTLILVLLYLRRYVLAMKSAEKLKQLYIAETDERHQFILAKTGGTAINIVICGLSLAAIAAGFFSDIVFISLLGSVLFTALVKGALKVYYNKAV